MFDKMNKNDIMYYLGLVVTVCLFVYIVMKCMTLQMNIIEGAVGGRSTTDKTDDSSADDTTKKSSSISGWFSKEIKKKLLQQTPPVMEQIKPIFHPRLKATRIRLKTDC